MADIPYDEKNPWGKPSPYSTIVTIGGDNIEFSRQRREATQAVKENRATPEQRRMVMEADQAYKHVLNSGEE
jgi:hypothetical protein